MGVFITRHAFDRYTERVEYKKSLEELQNDMVNMFSTFDLVHEFRDIYRLDDLVFIGEIRGNDFYIITFLGRARDFPVLNNIPLYIKNTERGKKYGRATLSK